ncbi:hypothetical protein MPH_09917 [Macrophomina phaseolina MS6]|uniref:Mei5 protein n=1 Tax=Macrophomina phaseolina (strain MS6) TaxID=1126212 RepID=K2S7T1_MACPH|nr:hypothetical protein MPH_09917 [Macrophomina phaseolina MS6]
MQAPSIRPSGILNNQNASANNATVTAHNTHQQQQQQQPQPPTITSLSDSARTAQAFFDAVRAFTASPTFHGTAELIDEVPRLRKLVADRERDAKLLSARLDEQRRDFERALADEKRGHESIAAAFLETYNRNYEKFRVEKERLEGRVGELEGVVGKQKEDIARLHKSDEELVRQGSKVRGMLEAERDKAEKAAKTIGELKKEMAVRAEAARKDVEGKNKELAEAAARLRKMEAELAKARSSFMNAHQESIELQKDLEDATERLAELEGFAEPLSDEKWENSISLLDELWRSAHDLISSYFRKDLPKEILSNTYAWTEIRDPQDFSHKIPLPRTNSPSAKSMRIAVILAILARLIDKYLFQPSYILSEESGLREVLIRQAIENSRREAFTRGIFLATFEDEQAEVADELVTRIVKELMHHIHHLLPAPQVESFRTRLEQIVQDARDIWWKAQRLRLRLEPDFQVEDYGWEKPIQFQYEHGGPSQIANGKAHAANNNKADTPQQSPQSAKSSTPKTPTTASSAGAVPSQPPPLSSATANTATTTTTATVATTPGISPGMAAPVAPLPPLMTNGSHIPVVAPDASLLLIFPRIYIVEDDDPEPVTPGTVLLKSQAEEAERELHLQQNALNNGIAGVGMRVASHRVSGGGGIGGGAGNGVMRVGGPRPRRLSVPQMEEIPEVPTPGEDVGVLHRMQLGNAAGSAGDQKDRKDFLEQGGGG